MDVDMLFDLRFLPNPFYIENLNNKTGIDIEVRDYIMKFDVSQEMLKKMKEMIIFLIPNFIKEGKSEIIIGIGCTGGNHRSVTFAYLLEKYLKENDYSVVAVHRDIRGK